MFKKIVPLLKRDGVAWERRAKNVPSAAHDTFILYFFILYFENALFTV